MLALTHYLPTFFPSEAVTASLVELRDVQRIADILQKLFTVAAIIIGGVWTYFNFFKGRTYRIRLVPEVSGKVVVINEFPHLVATLILKNVGQERMEIVQAGSAFTVLSCKTLGRPRNIIVSAKWENLATFPVFESHKGIEAGEEVREQRFLIIPRDEYTAFQLQLEIVSRDLVWTAMDIVTLEGKEIGEDGP
jgi:hypothetical protein